MRQIRMWADAQTIMRNHAAWSRGADGGSLISVALRPVEVIVCRTAAICLPAGRPLPASAGMYPVPRPCHRGMQNGPSLSASPCSKRVLRRAGVTVQVLANPVGAPVQFERLLADFGDSLRTQPNCFGKCQDLVFWPADEPGSNVAYAVHVVLLLMAIFGY